MRPKTYINGEIVEKQDAKVSVFDHGLLFGDGVFEGIRVYDYRIFRFREHLDRLWESAKAIHLPIPLTREEMISATRETVKRSEMVDGYIRLVVTRGSDPGSAYYPGVAPPPVRARPGSEFVCRPTVIIIADGIELYPKEAYEKGLEIATVKTIRNHPAALNPRVKSLNYLNNILAKMEATGACCQEALMLNQNNEVTECSADNFFTVTDGTLLTPPVAAGILEGVTRNVVIALSRRAGIPVVERPILLEDVYRADECFLTGTGAEVVPVVRVDGRMIGDGKPGAVTRQILSLYRAATGEEESAAQSQNKKENAMQFLVIAYDGTDDKGLERRLAARAEHVKLGDKMKDAGKMHMGVAILDTSGKMIGSVLICEFESRKELDDWLAIEPYVTGKVWEKIEVKPCRIGPSFVKS